MSSFLLKADCQYSTFKPQCDSKEKLVCFSLFVFRLSEFSLLFAFRLSEVNLLFAFRFSFFRFSLFDNRSASCFYCLVSEYMSE